MIAFHTRCPDVAARETRGLHVLQPGGPLPVGEYGFLEHYCEDPACDCRRVLIRVTSAKPPHAVLATINYGWEPAAFYTRWMHGDEQAGRDITAASLDPLHAQSQYADFLLDYFQEAMIKDPAYVARLARHYDLFKQAQRKPPAFLSPLPPATPLLTIPEILHQLQRVPRKADFAPYEAALNAAIAQREAITPELIAALDRATDDPQGAFSEKGCCLHHFALYLLAQFREPCALDSFLRFFSLPGEIALDLTGDTITEHGAAVLASVCGGDPAPLLRLARDEAVNMFVREQAILGLLVQHGWGERTREAVIADLRGLFDTLPKPGDSYVWAALVGAVCDFNATELLPEARRAFAEELVDEDVINTKSLDELDPPKDALLAITPVEDYFSLLMERNAPIHAVDKCSGWVCFRDESAEADWSGLDVDQASMPDDAYGWPVDDPPPYEPPEPYIAPRKIGRNEPCPCGSGKKYKKCCGK